MSTIDSKDIITKMLKNNGIYPGDPQVYSVFEYQNSFNGASCWKLCYTEADEINFLQNGHYKGFPEVLFRLGQLTDAGKKFLRKVD